MASLNVEILIAQFTLSEKSHLAAMGKFNSLVSKFGLAWENYRVKARLKGESEILNEHSGTLFPSESTAVIGVNGWVNFSFQCESL